MLTVKSESKNKRNPLTTTQQSKEKGSTPISSNTTKNLHIQAKLTIGQPGDIYEQEADRVASQEVNMPETSILQRQCTECEEEMAQTKPLYTQVTPLIQCQPLEDEEELLQPKECIQGKRVAGEIQSEYLPPYNLESQISHKEGKGITLPRETQAFMGSRFDTDFSKVKVHTDSNAARINKKLQANAFTHKNDIYFNAGQYNPVSSSGKQLIAHELSHVVQQNAHDQPGNYCSDISKVKHFSPSLTIQKAGTQAESSEETYHIDYEYARAENNYYQNRLGWGVMLGVAKKGLFSEWLELWDAQMYNKFADAVAQYQWVRGMVPTGIIDEVTWGRIADFPTATASITKPDENIAEEYGLDVENVCTDATECRLRQAASMTGAEFEMPEGKSMDMFRMILHTSIPNIKKIPEEYRGTGAAGALVYADMGDFVDEDDIWNGALQPGAVIQVWMNKSDFDKLKKGEIKSKEDLTSLGTSLVFVRYVNDGTEIVVRHKTGTEYKKRTSYGYWIAANPKY